MDRDYKLFKYRTQLAAFLHYMDSRKDGKKKSKSLELASMKLWVRACETGQPFPEVALPSLTEAIKACIVSRKKSQDRTKKSSVKKGKTLTWDDEDKALMFDYIGDYFESKESKGLDATLNEAQIAAHKKLAKKLEAEGKKVVSLDAMKKEYTRQNQRTKEYLTIDKYISAEFDETGDFDED